MNVPFQHQCVVLSALLFSTLVVGNAHASIDYHPSLTSTADVIIDVRPESQCRENSISSARCLPIEHVLASHNRLANFSGLFWLWGTLGLDGSERVALIGNAAPRRDFIAGLLFVAGQASIDVITQPASKLLKILNTTDASNGVRTGPGKSRSTTRETIYTAQPRTDLLVLKSELLIALASSSPPVLLDGRSESEYWGHTIKAARGGHLPGALHEPAPDNFITRSARPAIAYAHDSVSGFAYLARLNAKKINTQLYLGGWVEWALDANLAADAQTFALVHSARKIKTALQPPSTPIATGTVKLTWSQLRTVAFFLCLLVPGAYYCARARRHL